MSAAKKSRLSARSRRTQPRPDRAGNRGLTRDRRPMLLEQLERRAMLAGWSTRVDFASYSNLGNRPYGEVVMETRVVTLPGETPLPAVLNVSWEADDDLRINGTRVGTGYAGGGSTTVSVSSFAVTLELIDTVGIFSGGWVTLSAVPTDTGFEGDVCTRCPTLGPSAADGKLRFFEGPIVSEGTLSPSFGLQRDATGGPSTALPAPFGNGWSRSDAPTVSVFGTNAASPAFVSLDFGGNDNRVFRNVAPAGSVPLFERTSLPGSSDRLTLAGGQFVFRTAGGSTLTFQGHDASIPAAARGQLLSRVDASFNRLSYAFNADGSTASVSTFLAGQQTPQEVHTYSYRPATDSQNPGKVSQIDVTRGDGTLVRRVLFDYYGSGAAGGTRGDLRTVSVRNAAGVVVDYRTYRYTAAAAGGSLLQYTFDLDGDRRAVAAGVSLDTATNSAVAPFATNFYAYDAQNRVERHDKQGAGCSACTGGIGQFTYAYARSALPVSDANRDWRTKTTETRPDNTQRIVYFNARSQPLLEVIRTTDGGITRQYGTYTRYDFRGQAVWVASPEAIALPANLAVIEQYPDLLNEVAGNFQYINDTTGRIDVTTYATTTTAAAATAGSVDRFVSGTALRRGELGAAVPQEAFTYFLVRSNDGSTVAPLATRTADAQTTTYAYTFTSAFAQGWTTQIVSQRTTLPWVTRAQNGPGGTEVVIDQVFDAAGREIWSRDGDGFLRYTQYDARTGAVVKTIADVNTSRTADFQGLPFGWATPLRGGLHLVRTYGVDLLGRATRAVDPNGNVSYTVYDDVWRTTRTYVGWNESTRTTSFPVTVSRRDSTSAYTETLTYSASFFGLDAQGRPAGTEPIANLQSLTRAHENTAGQVIAVDRYTNLTGITYSEVSATLGLEGVNYLRTRYAYNNQGQVDRIQNPAGTIAISTYDGLARLTGTWVGTNDSTTNGFKWTPSNAAPTSNMVQVAAYEYDNGGVGNGNLTKATQFPGGSAAARVTQNAYDWRNRLVAMKSGATSTLATEAPSVNRPLSFIDYDNLDRVTGTSVFDGDGVWVIDANADGVPDKPAAGLLRSSQVSLYDAQDRVFRTQELFVDQTTGAVGTARLTTDMFYDRRGNVAAVYSPNAPVSQSRYDGAGRLTGSYTLGNVPAATWANATSLAASLILEQAEYTYDAASNVIQTTNRQRFHDASTTAFGSLGTPTAGIPARVSYATSYYNSADRLTASVDVGTNGGVAYVRPATVPARSDTALVTSYAYDTAGRVQDVTDPRGIVSRTLYNSLNQTTATIANYTGGAPAAQTDVTTRFSYDSAGRLASRTAVQPTGTPSQTTGYVYGVSPTTGSTIASNDLMAETRYPDPVTGEPSATERDTYTSNALGERTGVTDRAGTTHTYAYDVTGRQTADAITALGTGVDGAVRRIESAYDALGRLVRITSRSDATGSAGNLSAVNQVTRMYNGFGQMFGEWQAHTGLANLTAPPGVRYAYSEGVGGNHSRLTRITYPDGYQVNYAYDAGIDAAVSRPTSLSGQQAGSTTSVTLEAFKYLGAGTVIERSRPEVNVTLSMVNFSGATADAGDKYTGLDRFGRVVDQRWTQGTTAASPVLDRYGYTYDRNSNRLTRSNALAAAFSETYAYDALNQLQSFSRGDTPTPTTRQQWQFDALGNWTTVTTNGVANTPRTVNAQNELTQASGKTLTYTPTGSLATDAQGRTLAYDAWNRLVSVRNAAGTEVARYDYDGLNRRIVERVGTLASPAAATAPVRDVYYSQDWQVLEERVRTPAGAIPTTADTRFVWSPVYVDAMIARDRNADGNTTTGTGGLEERVYALQDANWNTTAIIAAAGVPGVAAGAVVNRFIYAPYGRSDVLTAAWATAGASTPTPWAHRFQGLEFTDVTNLFHARNRDYSFALGRFIQLDPIGFSAGDNNWYRFVGNGPTGKVDPSGLNPGKPYQPTDCGGGGGSVPFGWGGSARRVGSGRVGPPVSQPPLTSTPPAPPRTISPPSAGPFKPGGLGHPGCMQTPRAASKPTWNLGGPKSATKWANQMAQRGWTPQQIDEAIAGGQKFSAPNNINPGNSATRYVHPQTGRSVVVDDVTHEVLHVGGNGFKY
jgi:RHS repeat-associated protein